MHSRRPAFFVSRSALLRRRRIRTAGRCASLVVAVAVLVIPIRALAFDPANGDFEAEAMQVARLGGTSAPGTTLPPDTSVGSLLWEDQVNQTGTLDNLRLQQCQSNRIQVVGDPTGRDRRVTKMTVYDTDVTPCTPTENPRAQMLSPDMLEPGKDYWIGFSVFINDEFPRDVPRDPVDQWIGINSVYGPPYRGSSSNGYNISRDSSGQQILEWKLNQNYGWRTAWQMPMPRGKWIDFVAHYNLSANPQVGFREQWINTGNGWEQSVYTNGSTKQFYAPIDEGNNSVNHSKMSLYYARGTMPKGTLYFAEHKIGTGFGAVAPTSYAGNTSGETAPGGPAIAGSEYRVSNDGSASGGKVLNLFSNTVASISKSTPALSRLSVTARGSLCDGAPVMKVGVDGRTVATQTVDAESLQTYTFPVAITAGSHQFSVTFDNDRYTGDSCDRNLAVDKVEFTTASNAGGQ